MEYITDEGRTNLTISNKNITELPEIKNIEILDCQDCSSLNSIPNI